MEKTYMIKSYYLEHKRIEAYFGPKGWVKFDGRKHKNPTLIYLDGKNNIYDKSIYKYHSFIKNQIGDDKNFLSDKDNLPNIVQKKYQMATILVNLKNLRGRINMYDKFFKKDKVWILKPARGRQGIGIKIIQTFEEFKSYLTQDVRKMKLNIKRTDDWVLQEYILNPMLYNERKFHLRVYFMVFKNNIYLFPHYWIITAESKYKKSDFDNKDIHDTHYSEGSLRNKIFPEDTSFNKKEVDNIQDNMINLFKFLKSKMINMRCYEGDEHCYEMFAADMMLTSDLKLKILEINARIGWPGTMDTKYNLFEDQLNIVLGELFSFNVKDNDFILI